MRYLQYVEGMRPDVRVIPVGFLTNAWFRRYAARHLPDVRLPAARGRRPIDAPFTFREFVDANAPRPVYIVNRVPWLRSLEEAYSLWPVGVVERVTPRSSPPDLATFVAEAEASFARLDPAAARGVPPGQLGGRHRQRLLEAVRALRLRGRSPRGRPHRRSEVSATAARVFETMAERHPSPPAAVFKNLGVAYQGLERHPARSTGRDGARVATLPGDGAGRRCRRAEDSPGRRRGRAHARDSHSPLARPACRCAAVGLGGREATHPRRAPSPVRPRSHFFEVRRVRRGPTPPAGDGSPPDRPDPRQGFVQDESGAAVVGLRVARNIRAV